MKREKDKQTSFRTNRKTRIPTYARISMVYEDEDEGIENDELPFNDEEFNEEEAQNKKENSVNSFLRKYTTDLTELAKSDVLDPVIGREQEIERMCQILCRRKKNNPILIGESGVGKSAIVEGLAKKIVMGTVPISLQDKRILSLNLAAMVAGTKYRGQFEERIQSLLKELANNSNIIVFIDEIHTIIGTGGSGMDAANMLKPALARGEFRCIGATTLDEYRKSIEKDGALERRFQKIIIQQTTTKETLHILQNLKKRYETYHNVEYTDEAIKSCVILGERYIPDRSLPDKAIDIMDEAGSRSQITSMEMPNQLKLMEKEYEKKLQDQKDAITSGNFEMAASSRDEIIKIGDQLKKYRSQWIEQQKTTPPKKVDEYNIAQVVSMMTGIPVSRMTQEEGFRLQGMQHELNCKIIGQKHAIDKTVKAIQRSRIGLKDPNRPIGTFIFLGPTGVGKTMLAKQLAEFMFGTGDALIRIDMSEYMEKFNVSRLVGAPPGYVGFEDGGQLTEKVRRRPYSIVLLDEIEKAHDDVFNLLLQVMDEGRLTDSNGRIVDFRNTVIIMTSNIGSRQLSEFGRGVGFNATGENSSVQQESIIQKALHKHFSPEFLNRLDEIITFSPLNEESILNIIGIELDKLVKRLTNIGYTLIISDKARHFLAKKGYDPKMGARPLRRSIQTYLEDELSSLIINESIATGCTILADKAAESDKLTLKVTRMAEPIDYGMPIVNEKQIKNKNNFKQNDYAER